MKLAKLFIVVIVIMVGISIYLYSRISSTNDTVVEKVTVSKDCLPTFRDGGGPYYQAGSPFRSKIAPEDNNGEKLIVQGKILMSDCTTPIPNATLDIWQANESGSYEDEWYRGQITSGDDGSYMFETVVPKGYGEGTGYRPPHIHFKVFVNGVEKVTSQMFFPEVKGKEGFDDAYIIKVSSDTNNGKVVHNGSHDIILP